MIRRTRRKTMSIPVTEMRVLESLPEEKDRFLLEGPREIVFDDRDALVWVNIQTALDTTHGDIHIRFWDTGERRVLHQDTRPGFILPTDAPGYLVVGREKEIGVVDLRTNDWTPLATIPDANPRTIINDGEVVPGGRAVVFGTKDLRFTDPIAQLYLFTFDDRQITVLAERQTCSNGKCIVQRGDELMLFDIDTPTRQVVRYRLDLAGRKATPDGVALRLDGVPGFPDGMIACGDGSAIVAFYNPDPVDDGVAIRFALESGEMIEQWTTPGSPRVTCPLLVEREGRVQLVLTTAVEGMPEAMRKQCPDAGCLFIGATSFAHAPAAEMVRFG
jgi:sugar lactone lactonase YvrE